DFDVEIVRSFHSFFYCSGDPRDLHSFPTRRSSDLAMPGAGTASSQPRHTGSAFSAAAGCDPSARPVRRAAITNAPTWKRSPSARSEEHTSELQSRRDLVCRLLLEKKKTKSNKSKLF